MHSFYITSLVVESRCKLPSLPNESHCGICTQHRSSLEGKCVPSSWWISGFPLVESLSLKPFSCSLQVLRRGLAKALELCAQCGWRSVATSVIGLGLILKYPKREAVEALTEEIARFGRAGSTGSLSTVRIVIKPGSPDAEEVWAHTQLRGRSYSLRLCSFSNNNLHTCLKLRNNKMNLQIQRFLLIYNKTLIYRKLNGTFEFGNLDLNSNLILHL